MDGKPKPIKSIVMAVVAREFVPSRIERQLLAQVFELLSVPRSVDGEPADRADVNEPAVTSRFHGRRVA